MPKDQTAIAEPERLTDHDRAARKFVPVKILHVVHGLSRGGLENGVVNLLNGLPHPEFEQAVCCLDSRGEMADRIIRRDLPLIVMGRRRHDLTLPWRLAALYRRLQPDIVHCRNWNTWLDAALARLLAGGKPTLVWSFHGFADGDWFPRRRRVISRLLSSFTNELFAVCRDSAERYAGLTGIRPGRFEVLYNGVDCERFRPIASKADLRDRLGLPRDERIVLTVASLTPVKDHDALVRAAAQVVQGTASPTRFLFIGEGALRPAIEARLREMGLEGRVLMPGNSDRVPEYLAAADLFVLPSRLEGMSNAILEAMASGLPVVANQVGGNPELVEQGVTGLLCSQGDVAEMAEAIGRLVENDVLRCAMGAAARQRTVELFSIESMMDAYAAYYRGLAGGTRES